MFVGYSFFQATNSNQVEPFANPKTFPKAFTDEVPSHWAVVIDDDRRMPAANATMDAEGNCIIFFAKDKQTLKDGLKACPAGAKVSGGRNPLGFFAGSDDFEKFGGWSRQKQKAAQKWSTIDAERRQGLTRGHVEQAFNRQRLMERGYFLFVCRSILLTDIRDATKVIGTDISLNTLGSLVSRKMTRDQAVGRLMEDLLVA